MLYKKSGSSVHDLFVKVGKFQLALCILSLILASSLFYKAQIKPILPPFESAIRGWDDSFYYFWLRSPLIDGDFNFINDIEICNTMPAELKAAAKNLPRTNNNLIPNAYPIGWALSALPWFVSAHGVSWLINLAGFDFAPDGYGPIYQLFIMVGQFVYALLSLFFAYRIISHFFDRRVSLNATLLLWISSFMLAYQTVWLSTAHNLLFFSLTGSYYFTLRCKSSPTRIRNWVWVGLLSGILALSRYQAVVFLLYPAVVLTMLFLRKRLLLFNLCCAAIPFVILIMLQSIAWKMVYGDFFVVTYQTNNFLWLSPKISNVLFSPFHGLFYWHPIYFVALLAFAIWVVKNLSVEALCWSFSLLSTIYINAAWHCWWLGAAFGLRAFDGCSLFAMIGVAFILRKVIKRSFFRTCCIIVLCIFVIWNINLLILYGNRGIPVDQPVNLKEMINATRIYWLAKS